VQSATVIAKQTSVLCNACRVASAETDNPMAKRQFVQYAKDVANATAILVKEIKKINENSTEADWQACRTATKSLLEIVENLCQFASSPEYASVPAKISDQGKQAQQPILASGSHIIEGSCAMIQSAKSIVVNPRDPPTWQALADSSKSVSDAIKHLVSYIREQAPGQHECDKAIEKLTVNIRELDQASLAAINQNLPQQTNKDIKQFTEQMENAAKQIAQKLPEVQTSAKTEAEHLGHAIVAMVSYFDPLVKNAIGSASNMVSSKQQVLILDQTKTVVELAQQLLYAARESGGNAKATHVHGDIDESAEALHVSILELVNSTEKLAPNIGNVSRLVNCITESIFNVEDYRSSVPNGGQSNESFITLQGNMMTITKEMAKTAQDIVIKSTSDPGQLGPLASKLSSSYQQLASHAKSASGSMSNAEVSQRVRASIKELGESTIQLIKATGECQLAPNDAFTLRDVSESARSVGEKVGVFLLHFFQMCL
jgi:talin